MALPFVEKVARDSSSRKKVDHFDLKICFLAPNVPIGRTKISNDIIPNDIYVLRAFNIDNFFAVFLYYYHIPAHPLFSCLSHTLYN